MRTGSPKVTLDLWAPVTDLARFAFVNQGIGSLHENLAAKRSSIASSQQRFLSQRKANTAI